MILVLEGPEGVGKTTLSESLARYDFLPYRAMAWRDGRLSQDQLAEWRERGVPVNTYVDDVYAADVLACLHHNAGLAWSSRLFLDRSMPSGVAYAPEGPLAHAALVRWWASTLRPLDARIVHLDAPVENLMARLPPDDTRRHPERLSGVRSRLNTAVRLASALPTLRLDVSQVPYWDGEKHIGSAVEAAVVDWLGLAGEQA